jgi:hypothetical protein
LTAQGHRYAGILPGPPHSRILPLTRLETNDDRGPDASVTALIITGTTITSDRTARQAPGRQSGREVSWLPGQILDGDTATTAMILADIAAKGDPHHSDRLWPAVEGRAADFGLTGSDAITQAAQPPRDFDRHQDHAARQIDMEAAE